MDNPLPHHRLKNLDALRALAVLLVMAQHLIIPVQEYVVGSVKQILWIPSGVPGVNLFFIISGFCIALTAERSTTVRHFWVKRLGRILPAYWAAVILTFTVMWFFPLPGWNLTPVDLIANLLLLNMTKVFPHVDSVYWSLAVELKFYLLFGILLWYSRKDLLKNFALLTALASAVYLIADGLTFRPLMLIANNILIATSMPYFLVGIALYEYHQRRLSRRVTAVVVFTSIALATTLVPQPTFILTITPFILAALVAVALKFPHIKMPKEVLLIGLISYPLYLVHQWLGIKLMLTLSPYLWNWLLPLIAIPAMLILAYAFALTVEHRPRPYLEKTLRKLLRLATTHTPPLLLPAPSVKLTPKE